MVPPPGNRVLLSANLSHASAFWGQAVNRGAGKSHWGPMKSLGADGVEIGFCIGRLCRIWGIRSSWTGSGT
jgi:hypothetical protein